MKMDSLTLVSRGLFGMADVVTDLSYQCYMA
jgi:hypothetical protein